MPNEPVDFIRGRADQWRRELVDARIKLADEGLSPGEEAALWHVVDCRERYLRMLVPDFPAELEHIDRLIEARLRR